MPGGEKSRIVPEDAGASSRKDEVAVGDETVERGSGHPRKHAEIGEMAPAAPAVGVNLHGRVAAAFGEVHEIAGVGAAPEAGEQVVNVERVAADAALKVADRIFTPAQARDHEQVAAESAIKRVAAAAPVDRVISGQAAEPVVAGVAIHLVGADLADERVAV